MSRKRKAEPAAGPARFSVTAALFLLPLAAESALASRRYWFTQAAVDGHALVVQGAAAACFGGAALLALWRRAREAVERELEASVSPAALGLAFAGFSGWLLFIKYCQYRGFQLPVDTTASANLCWNLLHGFGWRCPVYGVENHFAVHFIPFFAAMAPLLLLYNGALTLIVAQTLLIATLPFACWLLARRLSGSGACAWVVLFLVATSPYLFDMAIASVYPGMYLSAFFLWTAIALELERPWLAAAGALLLLSTIEQACLAALGLCLYRALRSRTERRAAVAWLAAGAAALVLFALELRYKYSFPEAARFRTWSTFQALGPTPAAAARSAAAHPFETAARVFWPLSRFRPAGELLFSVGFLPLLAPAALLPWAVNFVPNFLADAGDIYHTIVLQYAGYVVGPLWWAAVLGACRARALLAARGRAAWLIVPALLFSGASLLLLSPHPLQPDWCRNFFSEAPGAVEAIPAGASVWADDFISPWLACRRDVKGIADGFDAAFLDKLFLPDYVVLDRGWATRAAPADRDRLLTLLGRERYAKVYERAQVVVLKHPRAPLEDSNGAAPAATLPEPGPQARLAAEALARNDDPAGTFKLALSLAEKGDDYGQFNAGLYLIQGFGVRKDEEAGVRWWKRAADQGLAPAAEALQALERR